MFGGGKSTPCLPGVELEALASGHIHPVVKINPCPCVIMAPLLVAINSCFVGVKLEASASDHTYIDPW